MEGRDVRSLKSRPGVVLAALFVVALATRVPWRSAWAYHWDSAEFALAVTDYNVALSQPHAPGYFLYVMLGRAVSFLVGDPHAALVWVSVVAGSLLVPVMFWLGTALFDRRAGWAAAGLAVTSPQLWFHSAVALTYVVDALLVCLVVAWCWRARRRGPAAGGCSSCRPAGRWIFSPTTLRWPARRRCATRRARCMSYRPPQLPRERGAA
jgi:4-amino-4-deoxy-L-arabinose transferase-like glycosyltransferase